MISRRLRTFFTSRLMISTTFMISTVTSQHSKGMAKYLDIASAAWFAGRIERVVAMLKAPLMNSADRTYTHYQQLST